MRDTFGRLAFDAVFPDLAGFEQFGTTRVPITLKCAGSTEAGIAWRLYAEVQRRISRSQARRRGDRRQGTSNTGVIVATA